MVTPGPKPLPPSLTRWSLGQFSEGISRRSQNVALTHKLASHSLHPQPSASLGSNVTPQSGLIISGHQSAHPQ